MVCNKRMYCMGSGLSLTKLPGHLSRLDLRDVTLTKALRAIFVGLSITGPLQADSLTNLSDQGQNFVSTVYRNRDGFSIAPDENKAIYAVGGDPTYGEITYQGLQKLLNDLALTSHDHFVDLGCGVGKGCMQVVIQTPARATGVELSSTRIGHALDAKNELKAGKPEAAKRLSYKQEDFTKSDLSDATILFMASTCFSDGLLGQILDKVEKVGKPMRLISYRALPSRPGLEVIKNYSLPMSWSDNVSVTLYRYSPRARSHQEVKNIIQELYAQVNGFSIDNEESSMITKKGGAPTYGEILSDSLKVILDDLSLTSLDHFLDLGCGVGKTCVYVALATPARATGIELSPTRVKRAQEVKKRLGTYLASPDRLNFTEGDIAAVNYGKATVVYLCSTCFSDELMNKIADRVTQLADGARVITLRPLPKRSDFVLEKTYNLGMTWSSSTPVYRYRLVKS